MSIVHPYYLIAFIIILFFSISEVFNRKVDQKWLWFLGGYLIILAGLRNNVGADYGSYAGIFDYSGTREYASILLKGIYSQGEQTIELEWLFVLINKIINTTLGLPFYSLTLVVAFFAIILKIKYIDDNTYYPFTFIMFVFFPLFFIGENGQIRQNLGVFIAYYAIRFIKEKKLILYLLCIYVAAGIHTVAYAFLPMYWIARIPLNKFWMLTLILISIFLSPFEVYRIFGDTLNNLTTDNTVALGFNAYIDETAVRLNGGLGIPEIMMAIVTIFLFSFDTPLKERFPYYEYHRNYAITGICFYFIFRNNAVFSTRLTGPFIELAYFIIINSLYVAKANSKRLVYGAILLIVSFHFIVFSSFNNIKVGRFTIDLYKNHLLP